MKHLNRILGRKYFLTVAFIITFNSNAFDQSPQARHAGDSIIDKKIAIAGIGLCETTLDELISICGKLQETDAIDLDTPPTCIAQDVRFKHGRGYTSAKYPGMIFQTDGNGKQLAKIRLTKDFRGNLPDGKSVHVGSMLLKDVFKLYPHLKEKWSSRDCSEHWRITNDTVEFYVKIDTHPRYPVDEAYYAEKPVEAIDIVTSCYDNELSDDAITGFFNDPVFFLDSVKVTRFELANLDPDDVKRVTVYKEENAIRLVGPAGANGAIYIETKKFIRARYWRFLTSRSPLYRQQFLTPESDSSAVYIVNGEILTKDIETRLAGINENNFVALKILSNKQMIKRYKIRDKQHGVELRIKR